MSPPIYVIPDIHGQSALLDGALALVARDGGAEAQIVFLGDYVDRGPDSRGVIETLVAGQESGRNWIALRGNHDQMFLDFLDQGQPGVPRLSAGRHNQLLYRLGGAETLASYGINAATEPDPVRAAHEAIPARHRNWLAGLPLVHETPNLLFVHAGIRPGVALDEQSPEDLMWIREEFHDHPGPHPWLVVHGHTPVEMPRHFGNRIDLDGGAGWGRPLWAAIFEGTECWLLTKNGRVPLRPPR